MFVTTVACYSSGVPGGIFAPMLTLAICIGLAFGEALRTLLPDAGEVRPLAGHEIGIDIHSVFLPKSTHSDSLRHLPKSARK